MRPWMTVGEIAESLEIVPEIDPETARKIASAWTDNGRVLLEVTLGDTPSMVARRLARSCAAPMRAPHYTIGKGPMFAAVSDHPKHPIVVPGEYERACGGVLYLDEATEFLRATLKLIGDAWQRSRKHETLHTIDGRSFRVEWGFQPKMVVSVFGCACGRRGTSRCKCSAAGLEMFEREHIERVVRVLDIPPDCRFRLWEGRDED